MKTKTVLLAAASLAMGALLFSCAKYDESHRRKSDADMIVHLTVEGKSSTKTSGAIREDDLDLESGISSLRMFLVANDLSKVTEIKSFSYDSVEQDLMVKLDKKYSGIWYLYVIANLPESMSIDSTSYDAFVGSYQLAASDVADVWEPGNFLMTNRQNNITEDDVDKAGISVDLNSSYTEESPLEVDVSLERLAAKVSAQVSPSVKYDIIGTKMGGMDAIYAVSKVSLAGVAMINNVTSFNLVQQWSKGAEWSYDGCPEQVLVSPSSNPSYAMSNYYNTAASDGLGRVDLSSLNFVAPGTAMYCLENNSPDYSDTEGTHLDASAGTKMKGRTTGIVFKVKVSSLSAFSSNGVTDGIDLDPENGEWATKAAAGTSDETSRTLYRYNGIVYAELAYLLHANPSLAAWVGTDLTDPNMVARLRSRGVKVYEDGYMYYTYWIEDPNYTDGGKHYYSVMRNASYRLMINSITSFGDDMPLGEYYATDPIETDAPILDVTIEVADWDRKTVHYTM